MKHKASVLLMSLTLGYDTLSFGTSIAEQAGINLREQFTEFSRGWQQASPPIDAQQLGQDVAEPTAQFIQGLLSNDQIGHELGKGFGGIFNQGVSAFSSEYLNQENTATRNEFSDGIGNDAHRLGANLSRFSRPFIVQGILATIGYYSISTLKHYLCKYVDEILFVPDLVTERSTRGWWDSMKKRLGWGIYRGPKYTDLFLATKERKQLDEYYAVLKRSQQLQTQLPSLLLYGPPGTGKTEVAKRMAKELDFNFAFLSGSAFSQYDEAKAVQKMSELFKWAYKSTKVKTIIFIDEAENLLANRNHRNSSEKSQKILSHFLSFTGSLHKRFTIIYATNRPSILDDAMNRRITYQIELGLPQMEQRVKIAERYFQQMIASQKELRINVEVDATLFQWVAESFDSLAGAYIEEMWMRAKNKAMLLSTKGLTKEIIAESIQNVIEKTRQKGQYISKAEN
ncbi:MAG: AAA family ATPase [Zetaproteobacteria bacterium]|nr:AAA family ATPase [Zetaproteobacteria bacterium]